MAPLVLDRELLCAVGALAEKLPRRAVERGERDGLPIRQDRLHVCVVGIEDLLQTEHIQQLLGRHLKGGLTLEEVPDTEIVDEPDNLVGRAGSAHVVVRILHGWRCAQWMLGANRARQRRGA